MKQRACTTVIKASFSAILHPPHTVLQKSEKSLDPAPVTVLRTDGCT